MGEWIGIERGEEEEREVKRSGFEDYIFWKRIEIHLIWVEK